MISELMTFAAAPSSAATIILLTAKSSVVVALGLLLWTMLRKTSASTRHLVLGATLVAVTVTPLISILAPPLHIPIATQAEDRGIANAVSKAPMAPQSVPPRDSHQPVAGQGMPAGEQQRSVIDYMAYAYALGAGAIFMYLLVGLARAWWVTQRAEKPDNEAVWQGIARSHWSRLPQVLMTKDIDAPLTWGVWRPVILLPVAALDWSDQDRRNALLHELAHVERRDWILQVIARLACTVHWYNPLVWIANRHLIVEAERAADDRVLETGTRPHEYAEQLVSLTRTLQHRRAMPIAATTMAEKGLLKVRIRSILDTGEHRMPLRRLTKFALLGFVTAAAVIVGSTRLVAQSPDEPDTIPLIRAAAEGDRASVEKMLRGGADVNQVYRSRGRTGHYQRTALTTAASVGYGDIVELLLDAGAPVDRVVHGDATALIEAVRGGHVDVVELLVDRGADVNKTVRGDGSPLIAAAASNNLNIVTKLLAQGADPDTWVDGDENALFHAANNGNVEMIQVLIGAGVDINQEMPGDGNALIIATRSGHRDTVEALIDAGARPDYGVSGDGNAMIMAAARGDVELLSRMIATGADVNAAVIGDGSPLIAAARSGAIDAAKLLVQSGADIDMVVPGDENALIGAAWRGDLQMVDYLLSVGADPTVKALADRGEYRTALSQATLVGHAEVAQRLRAAGAAE